MQGGSQSQPAHKHEDLGKKAMDKDLMAAVMGFSGTTDPKTLALIWNKWQRTTKFRTH